MVGDVVGPVVLPVVRRQHVVIAIGSFGLPLEDHDVGATVEVDGHPGSTARAARVTGVPMLRKR